VCKEKKLTNMWSSTVDIAVAHSPMLMSLEEAPDFITARMRVEVTPKSIRLRKRILFNDERHRLGRGKSRVHAGQ
jgi:GTP-binding protein